MSALTNPQTRVTEITLIFSNQYSHTFSKVQNTTWAVSAYMDHSVKPLPLAIKGMQLNFYL
jgi:hypothetical protein